MQRNKIKVQGKQKRHPHWKTRSVVMGYITTHSKEKKGMKKRQLTGPEPAMNAGGDLGSAAKGSAISLKVAGSSPVSCRFSFPSSPCHV